MTNREFFTAVINANISEDLSIFAQDAISKLDKKNATRSSKPNKTQIANEPIKQAIIDLLSDGQSRTSVEIASLLTTDETPITYNKVGGIAKTLVDDGTLIKTKSKVKGKGEMVFYSIA